MKKRDSLDLTIILVWPIIASIIAVLFKINAFTGIILGLVFPSIYLSIRGREYVKKVFLFSVSVSILIMIVVEYISNLTGTWYVISSIIPYRLFGFVTIEAILWAFSTCYFILIFYEYFINRHRTKKIWNKKMYIITGMGLFVFIIFLIALFSVPKILNIPYFYLIFGIVVLLIPFLVQLFKYSKITSRFFLEGIYFFYLSFIYEVVGLKLGWWSFPGSHFIGWVTILEVSFPVEEIIFWFVLLALTTISYYEFFDDDEK